LINAEGEALSSGVMSNRVAGMLMIGVDRLQPVLGLVHTGEEKNDDIPFFFRNLNHGTIFINFYNDFIRTILPDRVALLVLLRIGDIG
jgi:hypothetical protein